MTTLDELVAEWRRRTKAIGRDVGSYRQCANELEAALSTAPSGQAPLAEVKAQRKELRDALKKIDRLETMLSSAEDFAAKCQNERRAAEAALLAPPASAEPVAWRWRWTHEQDCWHYQTDRLGKLDKRTVLEPLYASPPASGTETDVCRDAGGNDERA